ncbi:hypothetical protein AWB71_04345 [Caballeronia peredens]|nr:hypothetical protein AWB71_04345 [Caballeronia peredens]
MYSAPQNIHIFVATPAYGATVAVEYTTGLIDLYAAASRSGFSITLRFIATESLITRARNSLVAQFLADETATHLMWIDADVGFKGADFMRLLQSGYPVCAGVYPTKTEGWPVNGIEHALPAGTTAADFRARYAVYPANVKAGDLVCDEHGFIEAVDAPTGFMLIERGVFVSLMNRYPDLQYKSGDDIHYAFFDTMIDPETRIYLSEDFAFCRLIRGIGLKPFVDSQSNLMHQGIARYFGDLKRSLGSGK